MSTNVRIGGATLVGVMIILGALYVQSKKEISAEEMTGSIVSAAPGRQIIPTTDSDGDGVEDWKAGLTDQIFKSIETPETTLALRNSESYTPPTTFTGKFAEAFFTDYMDGKVSGEELQNKDALINNAINAIEESTQSKIYTRAEVIVVPDSMESLREYGNRVAEIIARQTGTGENELFILKRAVESNDPKALEKLAPIVSGYKKIITEIQLVPVPNTIVLSHLVLLNALEAVLADVLSIDMVFSDPLYTMARVKRHESDALALFESLKKIASLLITQGVSYAKDEPGSMIYTFNI